MDVPSIKDLAEVSNQAFRAQFDPNSDTFHKGTTVPVPLNGQRVPQSMSTMYPQNYDPSQQPQNIDYGQNYKKVQADRNIYMNLKKSLAKLCPIVESFLRHQQIFKDKGDINNQNHIHIHQQNIKKQKINLEAVNSQLVNFLPQLQAIGEQGQAMAKQLRQVIDESQKKYNNKEQLTNFNFKAKKISAQTFSNAQKCLQKLKQIKKQHANNNKPKKQQQTVNAKKQDE